MNQQGEMPWRALVDGMPYGAIVWQVDVADPKPETLRSIYQNRASILMTKREQIGRTMVEAFPHVIRMGFGDRYIQCWQKQETAFIGTLKYDGVNVEQGSYHAWCMPVQRDLIVLFYNNARSNIESEAANKANQMKTLFLSNMSHELRTPMNVISGILDVFAVMQNRNVPETEEMIHTAKRACSNMISLLKDILDTTSIEEGSLTVVPTPTDLYSLCYDLVHGIENTSKKKGAIIFNLDFNPSTPVQTMVDPIRLSQVLTNLLNNAEKFTSSGLISLSVRYANPTFTFVVRDTGSGIDLDKTPQEQLFSRFYTVDRSIEKKSPGTGLGLWIVKQVVGLMDGSIRVESKQGLGSSFIVEVPLDLVEAGGIAERQRLSLDSSPVSAAERKVPASPASAPVRKAPEDRRKAKPPLARKLSKVKMPERKWHILYVEDNELNRFVVKGMLKTLGCTVELAVNGEEGVRAWKSSSDRSAPFDCILMDCHMPVLNGYDATKQIRTVSERIGLPPTYIVGFTASVTHGPSKCMAAGMDDFVAKPVSIKSMVASLERLHEWRVKQERSN